MHPALRLLAILFVFYVGLFITMKTGYHQKATRDKALLTENKIDQFESDVASNKTIDVISYLPKKEDYSNSFTNAAYGLSKRLSKVVSNKSKSVIAFFKALFIG